MASRVALSGSLALVTGAGSGIGRATALALAERGATVVAVDLDGEAADRTASECAAAADSSGFTVVRRGGHAVQCDVRDPAAVDKLAGEVHSELGTLTILVNNAGVGMSGPFLSMSAEDWEWIRSVNLDGVLSCCRAFVPAMLEAGTGQVVNLSSGLGYTPRATEPGYVCTKAAVLAFSLSVRADWRRQGVGVSAICPGIINTPIIRSTRYLGKQAEERERSKVDKLFSRGHPPERVARAIIAAIERDRAVVPVGWESWVGWGIHRFAPVGFQQLVARQSPL